MGRFVFQTLPNWVLGSVMLAGVAISFANIVSRYVFGHAIFWAEEILVYLTMWGVFIGMGAVAYNGGHLNMDLFSSRLKGPWRTALNAFTTAVLLACCAFAMVQSWKVVWLFVQASQVTLAAGLPKAVPHAALLAGFALTAIAVLVRIRSYLTGKF